MRDALICCYKSLILYLYVNVTREVTVPLLYGLQYSHLFSFLHALQWMLSQI